MTVAAHAPAKRAAASRGNSRHRIKDRGNDLYETHPIAVEKLLQVEKLEDAIWEPACGRCAITKPLREAGHVVYSTDLVDYGTPYQDASRWDFLMEQQAPIGVKTIITNPPFKIADDFVRKALELAPNVVMLLRLQFLESERRTDILDGGRLRRVWVFKKRLPMMHRDQYTGPKSSSTIAYAWFVWGDETGPTRIERI